MMWRKYHFYTHATEDYRPLQFNPSYPWWCTAQSSNAACIVAYLPVGEPLQAYWDDAFDITYTDEVCIIFSDRFPQPDYYTASERLFPKSEQTADSLPDTSQ